MGTLIDEPRGVSTGADSGTTNRDAAPADVTSARLVLRQAAQSGSGITRLTTQAYSDAEAGAITLLTGDSTTVGAADAALFKAALGSALTSVSTLGDLVTVIAAS